MVCRDSACLPHTSTLFGCVLFILCGGLSGTQTFWRICLSHTSAYNYRRFSTKPREPSPNRFGNSKDYNSRMSYDKKHDQPYPDKRGNSNREYDLDRKQPINPRSGPSSGGSSSNKYDRPYENRDRDIRNRDVPIRSKDNRFGDRDRDRSPHTSFRTNMRDDRDRRSMQDNKGDLMSREHRYQDNSSGSLNRVMILQY